MPDHAEESSRVDVPIVSPMSLSRETFLAEGSIAGDLPDSQDSDSPMVSPRLSPDQQCPSSNHDAPHNSRQHGSGHGSVYSSVLATPHQEVSDRFGRLDVGDIRRDSADHSDAANGLGMKENSNGALPVEHVSTRAGAAVELEGVDPLETGTLTKGLEEAYPRKVEGKDINVNTDASATSPIDATTTSPIEATTTSPSKSKLNLLPSALGFAAGLLPNVISPSSGKTGSTSDSEDKNDTIISNKRRPNERQTSTFSNTSSIHSQGSSNTRGSADSPHEPTAPGSSWRSLTSFLSRASVAPIQESPATPTPGKVQRTAIEHARIAEMETPHTSFLLHHITSPSAKADRRRSVELGGSQKLREGFERVKAEMVSAAKELREKEEQKRKRDSGTGPVAFDEDISASIVENEAARTQDLLDSEAMLGPDGVDWRKYSGQKSVSVVLTPVL